MNVFSCLGVFIFSFLAMEGAAWLTHRYVMHGWLWFLHEDHHQPRDGHVFQKNDLFFLVFSIPGIALIYFGLQAGWDSWMAWAGYGVTVYGFTYFMVHEGVIHRRIRAVPTSSHPYFVALRKAHGAHHRQRERTGCVCYGMLLVPYKYYRDEYAKLNK